MWRGEGRRRWHRNDRRLSVRAVADRLTGWKTGESSHQVTSKSRSQVELAPRLAMRQHVSRSFIALLCVSALVALHVAVPSDRAPRDRLARPAPSPSQTSQTSVASQASRAVASLPSPAPPLCVVVPYRERPGRTAREPERFAAYIRRWLKRVKGITRVRVWVLEQEDEHRFNRGFLINAGVALGRLVDGCDVFALHDVDLLPVDPRVPYAFDDDDDDDDDGSRRRFPSSRGPVHLSPPGVHPEYCYPTFRGGAWLFAWKHLARVNGYSHAYWGWGQEDDDLGARMRDANVTHARAFDYPGPRREEDGEKTPATAPCTGRVQNCHPGDHDPTVRDCGVYPYDTFVRAMFHPTPGGIIEGISVPPSRSLAEGTCFVHAHEGGFSRDEVERSGAKGVVARTSEAFQFGRRWDDVVNGRFRRDESTGLAGLVPRRCAGSIRRPSGSVDASFVREANPNLHNPNPDPIPGHGFQLLAMDKIGVVVRADGVADKVRETSHPAFREWLATSSNAGFEPTTSRWSGNAFLAHVCDEDSTYPYVSYDVNANDLRVGAYTRTRVRLTCDEEESPWCRQPNVPAIATE